LPIDGVLRYCNGWISNFRRDVYGYGYDLETTNLNNNSGSHEIFLRYELFKKE
jgi:hypothetical protein